MFTYKDANGSVNAAPPQELVYKEPGFCDSHSRKLEIRKTVGSEVHRILGETEELTAVHGNIRCSCLTWWLQNELHLPQNNLR